ncbi:MAG TPA: hypothetical protein VFA05_11310 [Gaiellaceae bacterium]|nr:hypothetical protein [Gaiellaceae bacterium]
MAAPVTRGRIPGGAALLLVPAAALLVHQLRYTLAYGAAADAQLTAQGHSYLHSPCRGRCSRSGPGCRRSFAAPRTHARRATRAGCRG